MKTLKYFSTPRCPICPAAKKMLEEITPQIEGKVNIAFINTWTDEGRAEAMRLKALMVPSFAVDDVIISKYLPKSSEDLLRKILEQL